MAGISLDWSHIEKGHVVNLVASMVAFDQDHRNHLMCSLLGRNLFTYHGELPRGKLTYSLLQVEVWNPMPRPILFSSLESKVLYHDCCDWDSIHENIEVCSGLGGLGFGALSAGFIPRVACDTNQLMLDLYKAHMDVPTVCGDICGMDTVARIWERCPKSTCLSSGIACQPYSSLGDGRSSKDPRRSSLPGTLAAAHYLRSVLLIAECVQPAQTDQFVVHQVSQFCKLTGFHRTEVLLQLGNTWPCSRNRWWCVLSAPSLGPISLKPLVRCLDVTKICHVMPTLCPWPQEHEEVLALQQHELEAFQVDDTRSSPYLMDSRGSLTLSVAFMGFPAASMCMSVSQSGSVKGPTDPERTFRSHCQGCIRNPPG